MDNSFHLTNIHLRAGRARPPVNLVETAPKASPEAIRAARAAAQLTQEAAAALVGLVGKQAWSRAELGVAPLEPARWALFLVTTGQHPAATLAPVRNDGAPEGAGTIGEAYQDRASADSRRSID